MTHLNHSHFSKVICISPALFKAVLDRGSDFLSLSEILTIVLDECHHTQKLHPYNTFMSTHYFKCPEESRPSILGLTSSPTEESIRNLRADEFVIDPILTVEIAVDASLEKVNVTDFVTPTQSVWKGREESILSDLLSDLIKCDQRVTQRRGNAPFSGISRDFSKSGNSIFDKYIEIREICRSYRGILWRSLRMLVPDRQWDDILEVRIKKFKVWKILSPFSLRRISMTTWKPSHIWIML